MLYSISLPKRNFNECAYNALKRRVRFVLKSCLKSVYRFNLRQFYEYIFHVTPWSSMRKLRDFSCLVRSRERTKMLQGGLESS